MSPEEYARRFNESFSRHTLNESIGIVLLSAGEGKARAQLEFSHAVAQPTGLFHAGAIIALADVAATSACLAEINPAGEPRPELFPLAFQISANLLRNTRGGKIFADAEIIHSGRTTMVANVRVTDESGKLMASVVVTLLRPKAAVKSPNT